MSKTLIAVIAASLIILSYFALRPAANNIIDAGGSSNKDAVEAYDLWKEFSPDGMEFKVSMPIAPRVITQSAFDIRTAKKKLYNIYVAEHLDSSLYIVTMISFPAGNLPEKDLQILENTVADLVSQGPNNTLKSAVESSYQGNKAVRFVIDSDTHEIMGITFVANQKLYILTRISKLDKINEAEFNRFLSSFKLAKMNEAELKK